MGESARRYHNYILAFQCYKTVYENDTDSKFSKLCFGWQNYPEIYRITLWQSLLYSVLEQNNNDLGAKKKPWSN